MHDEREEREREESEILNRVYDRCVSIGVVMRGGLNLREVLRVVRLPDGLLSEISNGIFEDCFALKEVFVPASVEKICDEAFMSSGLERIHFSSNIKLEYIGDDAFAECEFLETIELPRSVITLGKRVFRYCHRLKSAYLPSVRTMGLCTFEDCTSIEIVKFSDQLGYIPNGTFVECKNLRDIQLPKMLTGLGQGCFYNCINLRSVHVPRHVKMIQDYCFALCICMKEFSVHISIQHIGWNVFNKCDVLLKSGKVHVRGNVTKKNLSRLSFKTLSNNILVIAKEMRYSEPRALQDSLRVSLLWNRLQLPNEILLEFVLPSIISL
jgi:hypothetical protein